MDVLAAYVAVGGSVRDAAELVGIRPSTVKRHLADLRAHCQQVVAVRLHRLGPSLGRTLVVSARREVKDS